MDRERTAEATLVRPAMCYRDSTLAAIREFQAEGRYSAYALADLEADFGAFVQRMLDDEDRDKLPPHMVPTTNYWLVAGDEYIGRVSLRHELNKQLRLLGGHIGYEIRPSWRRQGYGTAILGLVLPKARERGLKRVLVTCDSDNYPSRRIIERNGGVADWPYAPSGGTIQVLRYWIALAAQPRPD